MTVSSEDLSAELIVETRTETQARYLRDFKLRNPEADTRAGTEPSNRAAAIADGMVPTHFNARQIADAGLVLRTFGARLYARANELGLRPLPAVGAFGSVSITTSEGGATIPAGRRLTYEPLGLVYEVKVGGTFTSADPVTIQAIDTGPQTSLPIGAVLKWSNPPPGLAPIAVVRESVSGRGLTGGRNAETDEELQKRIIRRMSTPAAWGNEAQWLDAIEDVEAHGIPVSKGFIYPAWAGPGTIAICFTVRPDTDGGSRIPSGIQMGVMQGYLEQVFLGDDHPLVVDIVSSPIAPKLRMTWLPSADGWADLIPWPRLSNFAEVSAVTGPLAFQVDVTGVPPTAGKNIALYNPATGTFARKRILSVSGSGPYDLVIDGTNGVSDTSFTPEVGALLSPWSDSLDRVVPELRSYFETLGPGEMFSSFVDDGGSRQRRAPTPPEWSSEVNNQLVSAVQQASAVKDAVLLDPVSPYLTPTGTPGTLVYLTELGDIAMYQG